MGRHQMSDVPPTPANGRRSRLRTSLLGASAALAVVAATFGAAEPASSPAPGEEAVGLAAWNGTLADHSGPQPANGSGKHASRDQRDQPPAASSSSVAVPPAAPPPAPVDTSEPAADAGPATDAVGTAVQPAAVSVSSAGAYSAPTAPSTDCTNFVSTIGSDTAVGSRTAPWRTVLKAINAAAPGTVLCVMPGTYAQEVVDSSVPDGTATRRVTLKSYDPANRAVLDGRFSLSNLSFWTIRDLKFTNPTPTTTAGAAVAYPGDNINSRIFSLLGGNDVLVENNEVYSGVYLGMLIARATASSEIPHRYTLRGNYIHDTGWVGLYFNPGTQATGMLIERNRFVNSANSENVKLGWGGGTCSTPYGIGQTEFRYNTMHGNARGALMIAEPGGVYDVLVHHNIFSGAPGATPGYEVRYYAQSGCLGGRAYVTDNLGYGGTRFSEDFGRSAVNKAHEARNVNPVNPQFDPTYRPTNAAAAGYGYTG